MADIDSELIGQVFNSIPYDEILGAPLAAAISAQEKASNQAVNFFLRVGFNTDENGVKTAVNLAFEHSVKKSDGTDSLQTINMPLIAVSPIPCLEVKETVVTLDVEVSQSAEVKENMNGGGEGEGSIGWGPFKVSLKARASYSKESTRKTDTRAKQHIQITMGQAALPEGMQLVIEMLRNNAIDRPAPKLTNETA